MRQVDPLILIMGVNHCKPCQVPPLPHPLVLTLIVMTLHIKVLAVAISLAIAIGVPVQVFMQCKSQHVCVNHVRHMSLIKANIFEVDMHIRVHICINTTDCG